MSSALDIKKTANLKAKMLLETINDIIPKYPNINDFIQRKIIEKCDREGMSIDEVNFLVSLEAKHFYKPSTLHVKDSIYC